MYIIVFVEGVAAIVTMCVLELNVRQQASSVLGYKIRFVF